MKIPPSLIVLDAIGAVLLGLGLAEHFAATELVPADLQFANYPIAMMVIGVLLMLPMFKYVFGQIKQKTGQVKP